MWARTLCHALQVVGGSVYAGGDFINIGGQARNNIAELDKVTALATVEPDGNAAVSTIAVDGANALSAARLVVWPKNDT